jgi:hypothetical protein
MPHQHYDKNMPTGNTLATGRRRYTGGGPVATGAGGGGVFTAGNANNTAVVVEVGAGATQGDWQQRQ